MKPDWTVEEIIEHFTLLGEEYELVARSADHNKLGQALLLKIFQYAARFPANLSEIPRQAIHYLAQQLNLPTDAVKRYKWQGRSIKTHRQQIREFCGFRQASVSDQQDLRDWLIKEIIPGEHRPLYLETVVYSQLRKQHIEPPTLGQVKRLVASAIHRYEQFFFDQVARRLSPEIKIRLHEIILETGSLSNSYSAEDGSEELDYPIHELKIGAGNAKVKNIKRVCARLKRLQMIDLPADLFVGVPSRFLQQYKEKIAVESPSHLRRRLKDERGQTQVYTMLAVFCWVRQREITDDLVDLFIRVLKDIQIRAEYREERRLLHDFIRVNGKQQLLFRLAEKMLDNPDGIISDVLYPIVGHERLRALVEESKQSGTYRQSVQTRISSSYTYHYRQILPPLLEVLQFRSNNVHHRPLIHAMHVVGEYLSDQDAYYPADAVLPIADVIQKQWQNWLYQTDPKGVRRIRRVRYELCVLQALRDKLRCKEVWVAGADRYRNPDEDTPTDFAEKRPAYYEALNLPLKSTQFTQAIKSQMETALRQFNDTLPDNDAVAILPKSDGWIRVKVPEKQIEPINLTYLKNAIKQRWWMTNLLDMLKETDIRIGFTDHFSSLTGQQRLPAPELRKRLLLCLFGLGTNTGLSSVSMGSHGVSYANLQYVRRRFISKDALRQAIRRVIDATLTVKQPHIWGETTTWCASDAKQFGAWDQNLRAQWHQRYRQAGVMVYWHVAQQSLCIYSQLKAPSSSEAAAMIEGVVRHCTAMQVDRNYVDTHGQSEVAFAFCHLLGFQLMPRFKNLHEQKLSLPDKDSTEQYPNLYLILQRSIDWSLIEQQYDEMVKYATAVRLGIADTEAILKRFTRHNFQHPTYKAFSELGRALKTIFLCHYLMDEAIRREAQESLNVVENWNSANGFIFYGKRGEVSTNDVDAQEIVMLAMHLVQTCLVYINTLMVQEVLAEPRWYTRMTEADWRGLTPLFYSHVNPYGRFDLDMAQRIPLMQQTT